MKPSTKGNLIIALLGIGSALVFFGGGLALALYVADWQKWFGLIWWTAFVFGLLVYGYGRKLKRVRPLAVLLAALGLHLTIIIVYLRSVTRFPDLFFLFFSPLEVGLVAFGMSLLADIDYRLPGRSRVRPEKWPPPGWHKDPGAARKHNGPK